LRALGLVTTLIAAVLGALPGTASASAALCNVPVRMSDGIVLRGNLWLPSNPDGSAAPGEYPTVLTVTGYNKDATNPTGQACSGEGGIASADTSLADRGYAVLLVDDRGTGASQGTWDSWGQRTQDDYQIEIYPTSAIFRKGDRIRLTIGSADTPPTVPSLPSLADSLGGEIRVLHGGRYASHVLLPVAPG